MSNPVETKLLGDDLRQAAAAALADVDALALTTADRPVFLKALLQARLGGYTFVGTSSGGVGVGVTKTTDASGNSEFINDGDPISRISTKLGVDRDTLELIYSIQDGEPNVVVSSKKISANKSEATRQLGQLVAAARQIIGLDEWTSATTIRKVVTDYGRLDSGNFAATIQQMDAVAVIQGKGQHRQVKITKPGFEATAELIKDLTGGEG